MTRSFNDSNTTDPTVPITGARGMAYDIVQCAKGAHNSSESVCEAFHKLGEEMRRMPPRLAEDQELKP
jgi:hypothetical protein